MTSPLSPITSLSAPLPISVAAVDNIPSALVGSTPSPATLVVIFNQSGMMSPKFAALRNSGVPYTMLSAVPAASAASPASFNAGSAPGIGISSNAPAVMPAVAAAVSI